VIKEDAIESGLNLLEVTPIALFFPLMCFVEISQFALNEEEPDADGKSEEGDKEEDDDGETVKGPDEVGDVFPPSEKIVENMSFFGFFYIFVF
jgi:hypothetical protein